MKNATARFVAAEGTSSLVISLRRNREHIKTQVRLRMGDEKATIGLKQYFDLSDEQAAQEAFDALVKDAVGKGWTAQQKRERASAFTSIPPAPVPSNEPMAHRVAGRVVRR